MSNLLDVREFAQWLPGPQVRVNMVVSENGNVTDHDGVSTGLSSPSDRALMRAIRRDANILLAGGASIRAEGWHPIPSGPTVVFTEHPESLPDMTEKTPVILVTRETLTPPSLLDVVSGLIDDGHERVLCEGGRHLVTLLLDAGAVTDINLSVRTPEPTRIEHIARTTFPLLRTWEVTSRQPAPDAPLFFSRWRCVTRS